MRKELRKVSGTLVYSNEKRLTGIGDLPVELLQYVKDYGTLTLWLPMVI